METPKLVLELDAFGRSMMLYALAAYKDRERKHGRDPDVVRPAWLLGELLAEEFKTIRATWPRPSVESSAEAEVELYGHEVPIDDPTPPTTPGRGWGR